MFELIQTNLHDHQIVTYDRSMKFILYSLEDRITEKQHHVNIFVVRAKTFPVKLYLYVIVFILSY